MLKRMLILSLYLVDSSVAVAASGKSEAQKNIELFDTFCVQNYTDYAHIDNQIALFNGKAVPRKLLQTDPAFKNGGKAYVFEYNESDYMIGYVGASSCSLLARNIDPVALEKIVVTKFSAKMFDSESTAVQTNNWYVIGTPRFLKGALLSIVYPHAETGIKTGSIAILSAGVVGNYAP